MYYQLVPYSQLFLGKYYFSSEYRPDLADISIQYIPPIKINYQHNDLSPKNLILPDSLYQELFKNLNGEQIYAYSNYYFEDYEDSNTSDNKDLYLLTNYGNIYCINIQVLDINLYSIINNNTQIRDERYLNFISIYMDQAMNQLSDIHETAVSNGLYIDRSALFETTCQLDLVLSYLQSDTNEEILGKYKLCINNNYEVKFKNGRYYIHIKEIDICTIIADQFIIPPLIYQDLFTKLDTEQIVYINMIHYDKYFKNFYLLTTKANIYLLSMKKYKKDILTLDIIKYSFHGKHITYKQKCSFENPNQLAEDIILPKIENYNVSNKIINTLIKFLDINKTEDKNIGINDSVELVINNLRLFNESY